MKISPQIRCTSTEAPVPQLLPYHRVGGRPLENTIEGYSPRASRYRPIEKLDEEAKILRPGLWKSKKKQALSTWLSFSTPSTSCSPIVLFVSIALFHLYSLATIAAILFYFFLPPQTHHHHLRRHFSTPRRDRLSDIIYNRTPCPRIRDKYHRSSSPRST